MVLDFVCSDLHRVAASRCLEVRGERVSGERIVRWRLLEDPSRFTLHFHFQHCKVTDFFPILQISALDFSRFSAQTPRIEYFLPLLSQEGCPDGRGGLNKGIIPHSDSPPNRGAGEVSLALLQTTPPIGSPPNLGGEEITSKPRSDALHTSLRLRTSLRCLAHLAVTPPLFRGNAFHYIARGIPTNRAKYSAEHCQASERNTGQTLAPPHSHRPTVPRPIVPLRWLQMVRQGLQELLYIIIYNNLIILLPPYLRILEIP